MCHKTKPNQIKPKIHYFLIYLRFNSSRKFEFYHYSLNKLKSYQRLFGEIKISFLSFFLFNSSPGLTYTIRS